MMQELSYAKEDSNAETPVNLCRTNKWLKEATLFFMLLEATLATVVKACVSKFNLKLARASVSRLRRYFYDASIDCSAVTAIF